MKKKGTKQFFYLTTVLVFLFLTLSNAQNIQENNFITRIFAPPQSSGEEQKYDTGKNIKSIPNSDLVIHNINNHLKKVAKLKFQGIPNSEIYNHVSLSKSANVTGAISGVIYESDGTTPIRDFCDITAFNEYGKYMGSDYTFDFKNGEYSIDELPDGSYYVMARADGYANEFYDNVYDWQNATMVEVSSGQETVGINFSLKKYKGSISGLVTDVNGAPIVECYLMAVGENNINSLSTMTGPDGSYKIEGLQSGEYKIQAEYFIEGKNYVTEWYDNVYNSNEAKLVSVVEPNTTNNINFVLESGGAIKGKVVDPSGSLVYANEVEIVAFNDKRDYIAFSETNENGEFIITGLSNKIYKLRIHYNGMKNYVEGNYQLESWYDGETDFNKAIPISVTISDTVKNITIKLREGGKIKGKVENYNGVSINYECEITAYLDNKKQCSYGIQVENGNYMIDKLPTGSYKLFANYFGHTQFVGEEPISEWYNGASNFDEAQIVEVTAPNTTENIDFTLERGGYISGKVFDSNGQPLSYSGFVVAFDLEFNTVSQSDILNEGMYFITGLPTGEYKLEAYSYDGNNLSKEWFNNAQSFETATIVSLTAPNHTSNINFTLESTETSSSMVQGFVQGEDGLNLTNEKHFIQLLFFDSKSGNFVDNTFNSMNGGYQLELMGTEFKIAAVSYYANWMNGENNDSLAVTYYENGISFNDTNTKTVIIENNTATTLSNIVMNKVSGSISGSIYYKNTEELISEGFIIYIFDEYGYLSTFSSYNTDFSNPEGKYSACGLRPGNYYALVLYGDLWNNPTAIWHGGYKDDINTSIFKPKITIPNEAKSIVVADGETKDVDFDIPIFTDVGKNKTLQQLYSLSQNYPNPFNPTTSISYSIPSIASDLSAGQASFSLRNVQLKVYDILGKEVATLVNENQKPGYYEVEFDGKDLTSGIYIYEIRAGEYIQSKKMLMIK